MHEAQALAARFAREGGLCEKPLRLDVSRPSVIETARSNGVFLRKRSCTAATLSCVKWCHDSRTERSVASVTCGRALASSAEGSLGRLFI